MNAERFFLVVLANALRLSRQFGKLLFKGLLSVSHGCLRFSTRLCYFSLALQPCSLSLLSSRGSGFVRTLFTDKASG